MRGKPKVSNAFVAGLSTGHPSLGFRIRAAKGASRLRSLMIALPNGLRFVQHRVGNRLTVAGVHVSGGRVASMSLSHGHLVIRLRSAAAGLVVKLGSLALAESSALKAKARGHRLPILILTLATTNAAGKRTVVRGQLNHHGR